MLPGWAQSDAPRVWGYVAWWMGDGWRMPNLEKFERLIFVQVDVSRDGTLGERHGWPERWTELRQAARSQGIPLDVAVTVFDAGVFNQVFGSRQITDRLADNLLAWVVEAGFAGVHMDVEVQDGLLPEAVTGFRRFMAMLAARLAQSSPARSLSAFLPSGSYLAVYDRASLQHVDYAILQGYDAHYLDSPVAGPVAPLAGADTVNWEKMLAASDRLGLARQKVAMGFPLYGYEWTVPSCLPRGEHVGEGRVTMLLPPSPSAQTGIKHSAQERVAQHGARVEPVSNSLYYLFVGETGVCTVGWFEDSWSLEVRTRWITEQKLAGIAFFPLGYDQGALTNPLVARWATTRRLNRP